MLRKDGQIKRINCRTRGSTKAAIDVNGDGRDRVNSFIPDRNKN